MGRAGTLLMRDGGQTIWVTDPSMRATGTCRACMAASAQHCFDEVASQRRQGSLDHIWCGSPRCRHGYLPRPSSGPAAMMNISGQVHRRLHHSEVPRHAHCHSNTKEAAVCRLCGQCCQAGACLGHSDGLCLAWQHQPVPFKGNQAFDHIYIGILRRPAACTGLRVCCDSAKGG